VGRFLGWKYATIAHQDTSKWARVSVSPNARDKEIVTKPQSKTFAHQADAGVSSMAPGFASAAKLPTGYLPTAVAQGDFNGDGKMDLAISNGGDNTIYVFLGNGDGSFGVPEVLYTSGQSPVWLAAAKLRTSGHVDLIAVDGDSNLVEVFSGNGDGTFQPSSTAATLSQTPTFVLTGDFNRDGLMDLAIGLVVDGGSIEPQFEILDGDGNGAFPSVVHPPAIDNSDGDGPLPTNWLASGDVNNDSQLDLVTTVAFAGAITYLNQGGTGFTQGAIFNPVDTAIAVGLGDMNQDGCPDAVETGGYGLLTVAKGNCDGTFTQNGATAELGDVDVAVTVSDVNGDGKLDVIASSAFSNAEIEPGIGAFGGYLVSVLQGDGAGNLAPAALYRVASQAYSLAVVDLTGTNRPDIVTIGQTESTASLLVNDGNGGFGAASGETIGYLSGITNAPDPSGVPQTVDLNGDGKPDVVMIEFGTLGNLPSQVTALLNDGTGKFSAPIRSPLTVGPDDPYPVFVAANFRNAAIADLIYFSQYNSQTIAFIQGNGDGTFGAPVTLGTVPNPYELASGDFNGDGKLDFAVFGYAAGYSSNLELDVFLGNGDGTFKHLQPQTFSPSTSAAPQQLIAGDFNHDGKLDLLIDFGDLDLALGNGDGTFQTPTTLMANFGAVAVADLNHDGYLDLVQSIDPDENITQGALIAADTSYLTPAVTVYLGGTGGSFTKQGTYFAPGMELDSENPALVGDFNADGNLDVALAYLNATIGVPWERRLQVFQGNGDGTLTPSGAPYQLPDYDLPAIGGDYRGGGATDLLDLVGSTSSINILAAAPASALTIASDSSPLTGIQGSATVSLALPAASGQTVQLSSSDSSVTLPGSLTFSKGQTQQSFSFTLGSGFDSTHLLALSANLGGQTETAYFAKSNASLSPGVVASIGASTSGTSAVATPPGGSIPLIFTLHSVAGYSGVFSKFACLGLPSGASCDFAQSSVQLLPGGYAQVAFDINTTSAISNGTYNLTISGTNGEISPSVPLTFGVGGFSLSLNPSLILLNAPTPATTTVTATYTDGFSQSIQLTCNGLPVEAVCSVPGVIYPANPSTTVTFGQMSGLPPQDYPFIISGTAGILTTTANATLRVSNFSATLATDSASLTNGQSATFNVQFKSLNHFSNSGITLSCQNNPATVTCSSANPSVSLSDGGTATTSLTVTYHSAATSQVKSLSIHPWTWAPTCLAALLLPFRRRWRWVGRVFAISIALLLLSGISACGSGGSTSSGGTGPSKETISFTVLVQASTGFSLLQQTAGTITLTVTP
jgi:hypothetical protein